ncbi:MAG: hypothetical protein PHT94_04420 [Candidatus Nanoarchaeia archaeon]|nr:hypothetical protein [Candidatus Nanoarchaeia archaeon]
MKKAETGIGTLIIFIAMIMVSAIAANVLISTSSSLQSKALDTGKRVQEEIGGGIRVVTITGTDGTDGNIENFSVVVKLKAGGSPIKFNTTTISLKTDDYNIVGSYSNESLYNSTSMRGTYSIDYLLQSDDHIEGYLNNDELVEIKVHLDDSIGEDEKLSFMILPSVGFSSTVDFSTPYVMTTKNVMLYP